VSLADGIAALFTTGALFVGVIFGRRMTLEAAALEALRLAELADGAHLDCRYCEAGVPAELCPTCFPAADAARTARHTVLTRARAMRRMPIQELAR
jgi:hypothetical protein